MKILDSLRRVVSRAQQAEQPSHARAEDEQQQLDHAKV
jgi:hypothetical protein